MPAVGAINGMLTVVVAVCVIVIVSVDCRHVMTDNTNVVVAVATVLAVPAYVICPVTVVVYTPLTVGADHVNVLVAGVKVINAVL